MSWMLTAGGRKVVINAIEVSDIAIEDIAASLAKICRFTGHCRIFWSVAEHSMLVSAILASRFPNDHELQLCGLLHDATEAYLQDLATPLKNLIADYGALEHAAWFAVAERFGLPLSMPLAVKIADVEALAVERRDLMPEHEERWSILEGIKPPAIRIGQAERDWRHNERLFLDRFHELTAERAQAAARSIA
jgi:hypothetical protein